MNCLAFRFSAMGDVALTVPVLRSVLEQNPDLHLTLVSNKEFEPFFYDLPRFEFYGVDLNNYKGITGLLKLYRELKKYQKWHCVTDLHSVMRTWVLSKFFKWSGIPVFTVDKGRVEKKALTQKENKQFKQLAHTTERYQKVFEEAGIKSDLIYQDAIHPSSTISFEFDTSKQWIGIAPFSKHVQKEWPRDKVKSLIEVLDATNKYEVLLFGGGDKEKQVLDEMANSFEHVHSVVGQFTLSEEIALVKKLSALVSMDSFNMHLASLLGVKVVSIWGATHSFAGFGPVNGNEKFKIEVPIKELDCRPCSVFGSKPCHRGDLACMQQITVEMVEEKVNFALKS